MGGRAANELKRAGVQISAGGIRSIWLRHDLAVKALRLNAPGKVGG